MGDATANTGLYEAERKQIKINKCTLKTLYRCWVTKRRAQPNCTVETRI